MDKQLLESRLKLYKKNKEEKIANMAAEWWANKVCRPKFDNGDDSEVGFLGSLMAHSIVKPVTEEMRKDFVCLLSKQISKKLNEKDYRYIQIGTDYHPDKILRESAENAGISLDNFPWKTHMFIDENHISVSDGYRSPQEIIYQKKMETAEE